MQKRTLGRTGLSVSEIGFGSWGIGRSLWVGAEDSESLRALNRAVDLGLNFIDTALGYGEGHSERLVGQIVRSRPETIYVSTKVPPKNREWPARDGVPATETFPADYIVSRTESSLKNLGLDRIDIQQLHVWSDQWVGQGDWVEAIEKLKREGKIRFFGISINDHQPENAIQLVESGLVDTVQVIYNIFDQTPEERLFEAVQKHNVGVIVRVPFDEGGLTGKITPQTTFPEGDFRNRYFRGDRPSQVFERVNAIQEDLGIKSEEVAETALRFVLNHPAVSTVIPGMRSVDHAEKNCRVSDGKGLSTSSVEKLRAHRWDRNFYTL
ncbi:MAG: aldo/keto reductase [Planctomycetota bacterium]|nr:aldo/keto reductase [Planctomycetota bacterium]